MQKELCCTHVAAAMLGKHVAAVCMPLSPAVVCLFECYVRFRDLSLTKDQLDSPCICSKETGVCRA